MKKIGLISIACSFLLAGCWDERLIKDLTLVPLIGIEGELGNLTLHYTFGAVSNESMSFSTVEGSGVSVRESRLDANRKSSELLDVSQLEVLLLSTETVKSNIIDILDSTFRTPRNRLSSRFVVVEGEISPYMEKTEKMPLETPDFYNKLLETAIFYSVIPDIDIQKSAEIMFDDAIELALPFIKMSEATGLPELSGLALFSEKKFTGHTLNRKESIIVQVIQKKTGKYSNFTYMREKDGKTSPITVKLDRNKKKWKFTDSKIDATYNLKFTVEEFPHDDLDDDKIRKELEVFLSSELTKDFNEVIKKLQEAKSDVIGFGRTARAFHPTLWKKGKWQDTFSEIPITVKVKAEIARTGILN